MIFVRKVCNFSGSCSRVGGALAAQATAWRPQDGLRQRVQPLTGPMIDSAKPIKGGGCGSAVDGFRLRSTHPTHLVRSPYCVLATIGLPSMNLILFTFHEPPGAPLRSGSMVRRNSSPALSDLLVQPSRARALGLAASRFHG